MNQGWMTSKEAARAADKLWPWNSRGNGVAASNSVQQRVIGVIRAGRAMPYQRNPEAAGRDRFGRTDDVGRGAASLRLRGR